MATEILKSRIYAPAEDENKPNERKVLYPETNIESVITREDGTTLKDDIGHKIVSGISAKIPSDQDPQNTGRPVLYIKKGIGTVSDYTTT